MVELAPVLQVHRRATLGPADGGAAHAAAVEWGGKVTDYYAQLGVSKTASVREITKAQVQRAQRAAERGCAAKRESTAEHECAVAQSAKRRCSHRWFQRVRDCLLRARWNSRASGSDFGPCEPRSFTKLATPFQAYNTGHLSVHQKADAATKLRTLTEARKVLCSTVERALYDANDAPLRAAA